MATRTAIIDGMAAAIWEVVWSRYWDGGKDIPRPAPPAAREAAEDLEKLILKMNCVEAAQETMVKGADYATGNRRPEHDEDYDFGMRLAMNALGERYYGHQVTAMTPRFSVKLHKHAHKKGQTPRYELIWNGEVDLGIEGSQDIGEIRANPDDRDYTLDDEREYLEGEGWTRVKVRRGWPETWEREINRHWYTIERSARDDGWHIGYSHRRGDPDSIERGATYRSAYSALPFVYGHARLPSAQRNPHHWPASEVQSLLFDVKSFTADQAKHWAKEHGYHYGKVDTTGSYHRLRQEAPHGGPCRTVEFGHGIKAIVCAAGGGRPPGVPR